MAFDNVVQGLRPIVPKKKLSLWMMLNANNIMLSFIFKAHKRHYCITQGGKGTLSKDCYGTPKTILMQVEQEMSI